MADQEQAAEDIFGEALDLDPEERRAFLDQVCRSRPALRASVEALLEEHDRLKGFLSESPFTRPDGNGLPEGTRLGRYTIVEPLGAGGMGEVYRAHDAKLGRDVALKLLPGELAHDTESVARLEREARTLAALNHPNIAIIHGLEEWDGLRALVMELVKGETLAERLHGPRSKALSADEALPVAKQIAEALEYAHERGVIHRDLKPANVKITPEGAVKVLDFGLAKVLGSQDSAPRDPANSPTVSAMATKAGIILGTAAYMAPEQAKGKQVDRRADIWAFGCVLFEMLAGKKAFEGETISDLLAAVIKSEPDWTALPETTPPAIRKLMRRCLVKDPKQRLRDIGDARIAIEETLSGAAADSEAATQPGPITSGGRISHLRRALPWALGTTTILLAAAAGWLLLRPSPLQNVFRLSLLPPENAELFVGGEISLSPNGQYLAFIAQAGPDTPRTLWVRPLDGLTTRSIPGTENAFLPFWSPDSQWIGFGVRGKPGEENKLEKVPVSGGTPLTLCDALPYGSTWNREDVILFSNDGSLYRVSAGGGIPVLVLAPDKARQKFLYRFPHFLPDGRHFLFLAFTPGNQTNYIEAGSLDSKAAESLVQAAYAPPGMVYAPPGYLLYVDQGTLMARPFSAEALRFTGSAVSLAENVGELNNGDYGYFSVSPAGVLAYGTASAVAADEMTWFSRAGQKLGTVGPPDIYSTPALSPDGNRVAVSVGQQNDSDIWIYDLTRGTDSRLTFNSAGSVNPVWTTDGGQILFSSLRSGLFGIYEKAADGLGSTQTIFQSKTQAAAINGVTADGRYAIFDTAATPSTTQLWALPLFGDHQPLPFIQGDFGATSAQFSPNGRYLAYTSNETGTQEVYVQTFPQHTGKWQISTSNGMEPMWRRDGKELYYLTADDKLMAVDVNTAAAAFQAGIPKELFQTQLAPLSFWRNIYVPSPDGQRFLMLTPASQVGQEPITVVVNWPAMLEKSN